MKLSWLLLVCAFLSCAVADGETNAVSGSGALWRFEFDNDIIGGSDDFFSAGWAIQRHSAATASWDELKLSGISRWIARSVPGISGGNGLQVKKGIGLAQIIQTPGDLSQTTLIEDDVPYAGVLGIANSWMALNDNRLNAFQVYLGVLGPPSLAEEVQTFVHTDLGWGEDPLGWDNQLETEPIVNLNYSLARKIGTLGVNNQGWGADLSYGGGAGLGNLFTLAQVGVQSRLGWRLPEGFTPIPDMAGRGIIMDPVLGGPEPGSTQFYFSAALRGVATAYTVLLDGNTFKDSHSVDYNPLMAQLILGAHVSRGAFGFHVSMFLTSNPVDELTESDLSWVNFSLDYRFH